MLLNNFGSALTDLDHMADAQICFDESIALSREAKDLAGEARTLNNLAVLLEKQGQFENALRTYQHAAGIFLTIGDTRREIMTLINIASVAWRMGEDQLDALSFFRAWQLAQKTRVSIMNWLYCFNCEEIVDFHTYIQKILQIDGIRKQLEIAPMRI